MNCKYCNGKCKKDGFQRNGCQRYKCKECKKKQQKAYKYHAYNPQINSTIITYTKEGIGIRSAARLLKISTTTLLNRIVSIAKNIKQPIIISKQVYEVDEIKSFVKCKKNLIWIVYALNRKTKEVVSYNVGNRTNATLEVVTKTLDLSNATKIYTDKWRGYKSLINGKIHSTFNRGTNHIERHNLTLRTHLKRLTRRSICFSRSAVILSAVLKIYFWG
ncbi:IS1 family transposase [Prevotella sp. 10(H)]|uniref:IS1 family transposase n=1 Tax=Prevotella sp. 10(H) TaxID=1158294 RepID=UPI0004A74FB6|nr:IS1 family transposase [Prevotella sp. 10(H)]